MTKGGNSIDKNAMWIGAIYMVFSAYSDWKSRTIDTRWAFVFGIMGMIMQTEGGASMLDIGNAMIPGFLLILISLFSGGSLGIGDGIFLLTMGLITGKGALLLLAGLLLCGMFSLTLVVREMWHGRNGKGTSLPLIMFMLPVYLAILVFEMGGIG